MNAQLFSSALSHAPAREPDNAALSFWNSAAVFSKKVARRALSSREQGIRAARIQRLGSDSEQPDKPFESASNCQLHVMDSCDQTEADAETLSSVSAPPAQNAEHHEPAEDMLDQDAFAGRSQAVGFLFLAERTKLGFLGRCLVVWTDAGRALVTGAEGGGQEHSLSLTRKQAFKQLQRPAQRKCCLLIS